MANTGTVRIKRAISPQVSEPAEGTWSNCLVADGIAYIAGMVSRGGDGKVVAGDEYEQARVIFFKIKHLVEAAGGVMADVVKVTIFVTDITQRERSGALAASFLLAIFLPEPWCKSQRLPNPR